jgi:hypothetical protein
MPAQTTTWIYPPRDAERKSYLTQWACACEVPALHPFTASAATHTLTCPDCQARVELELSAAIDVPSRRGIAPLEIRCQAATCGITTQIWHPLPKGQRIRINCAKCGKFAETTAR